MIRAGLPSFTESKRSKSMPVAPREKTEKLTPPSRTVAPSGELRPDVRVVFMGIESAPSLIGARFDRHETLVQWGRRSRSKGVRSHKARSRRQCVADADRATKGNPQHHLP